jgi:flagellar operon protein
MPPKVHHIAPVIHTGETAARPNPPVMPGTFKSLLQRELSGVKFSGHAIERLNGRRIEFSPNEASRLVTAVEKAAQKGAQTSLVLIDDLALVVSIKNRTVITVADSDHLKDNVFTNIDSAVIV